MFLVHSLLLEPPQGKIVNAVFLGAVAKTKRSIWRHGISPPVQDPVAAIRNERRQSIRMLIFYIQKNKIIVKYILSIR